MRIDPRALAARTVEEKSQERQISLVRWIKHASQENVCVGKQLQSFDRSRLRPDETWQYLRLVEQELEDELSMREEVVDHNSLFLTEISQHRDVISRLEHECMKLEADQKSPPVV